MEKKEDIEFEASRKIEYELGKLVLSTYNKVALWNNSDFDSTKQKQDALKVVCQDIVQNALNELLGGMDVKTNTIVSRGDIIVGDQNAMKDSKSFEDSVGNDIFSKLFEKK